MGDQPRLKVVPLSLAKANQAVSDLHRHHKKVTGHRFSIGCRDELDALRGVAIVGRPVARMIDQENVVEVTRVATDGAPNACSHLYGAVCRIAKQMGFHYAMTYTLGSEPGTSLRAAGWRQDGEVKGRSWTTPSRPRIDKHPTVDKVRWVCRCATADDATTDEPTLWESA